MVLPLLQPHRCADHLGEPVLGERRPGIKTTVATPLRTEIISYIIIDTSFIDHFLCIQLAVSEVGIL